MPDRRNVLTPDALVMMDTIERTGSFAAAARDLGKVPSALTYSVRQLEEALDVLLFDRRSRQAKLTAAGSELLVEGRRLLAQMDAVANRVQRVASGWETQLTIAVDGVVAQGPLFDLMQAFYELSPPTRLKVRHEILNGTWEALATGQADIALGVKADRTHTTDIRVEALGRSTFVFVVAPHHPLARIDRPLTPADIAEHRIVAVADTSRGLDTLTIGILPGQDVLTLATMPAKREALLRGLGCGFLPEPLVRAAISTGRLVQKDVDQPARITDICYAWRQQGAQPGKAQAWWLQQLSHEHTRLALLNGPSLSVDL